MLIEWYKQTERIPKFTDTSFIYNIEKLNISVNVNISQLFNQFLSNNNELIFIKQTFKINDFQLKILKNYFIDSSFNNFKDLKNKYKYLFYTTINKQTFKNIQSTELLINRIKFHKSEFNITKFNTNTKFQLDNNFNNATKQYILEFLREPNFEKLKKLNIEEYYICQINNKFICYNVNLLFKY
jgi:hypothetical protein